MRTLQLTDDQFVKLKEAISDSIRAAQSGDMFHSQDDAAKHVSVMSALGKAVDRADFPDEAFEANCAHFDELVAALSKLRAAHFNANAEHVTWGDVGSLRHANEYLAHALDHYGALPETDAS